MARLRTLRLFFSYRWPEITLESAEEVDMTPPPTDPLERSEAIGGFWYELHDATGRGLYRRIASNPIPTSTEVLTDDRERPIAREQLSELSGHFVLIAPNLPDAATVVLLGTAPEAESLVESATELARFELPPSSERPKIS